MHAMASDDKGMTVDISSVLIDKILRGIEAL
jgi:hypothetical protein